ncbi:MAG: glutamate racemase [bacterium]|nr:glutamate racemase [bacterium]
MIKHGIGIFDSGLGGLTVMKAIKEALPCENIIYFGDTARVPYGNKSPETIKRFAKEMTDFLCSKNIKILVVACNTASAFALEYLKTILDIPVVGVIEPGSKSALEVTKTKKIGVIGTKGTINSGVYENILSRLDSTVEVQVKACPLFVPLVEEGWVENKITEDIAKQYLADLTGIDTLILGCTHYPILKKVIENILGDSVIIVDSAIETAQVVRNTIKLNAMEQKACQGQSEFFVSDDPGKFREVSRKFLDEDICQEMLLSKVILMP